MRDPRGQAIAALRGEIAERLSEVARLESALEVIERAGPTEGCSAGGPDSPCYGQVWSRWCRQCGTVVRRCGQHGGLRAAGIALETHRETHDGR